MRGKIANLHRWLSLLLILAMIIAGSPSAASAQNFYQYWTSLASAGTVDEQDSSIVVLDGPIASLTNTAPDYSSSDLRYNVVPVDGLFHPSCSTSPSLALPLWVGMRLAGNQAMTSPTIQQPDPSQILSPDQQITILQDSLGKLKTKVLKVEFYWSFLLDLINVARGGREVKLAIKQAVKRELKHLLADDFIQTGPDAKTINKAEYIDSIVGKQDLGIGGLSRIDECTYNGESAVINGRIRVSQGGGYLLFTDMLAKRDGRWRIISRHLSHPAKQQVQGSDAEPDNSLPDKR